jgi:NAD(P)-dependent dehydrogenase (short-subunit alcohol dehydrogenase family)
MKRVLIIDGSSGMGKAIANSLKDSFEVETLSRNASKSEFKHHIVDVVSPGLLIEHFKNSKPYDHLIVTAADSALGGIKDLENEQIKHTIENKLLLSIIAARDIPRTKTLTLFSGYLSIRPNYNTSLQSALNSSIEGLTR